MLLSTSTDRTSPIGRGDGQPIGRAIPAGHVGPLTLPGSGRTVWWTGRVAIGLRHEQSHGAHRPMSASALWLQTLLLSGPVRRKQAR